MKMRKACDKDLCDIRKLYMSAFPECERQPFERLVQLWRNGMSRVYTFDDDGFAGFISTLDSADVSLINFFAVDAGKRCGGIGSRALEEFLGMENGRRIFLEIERIMPHDGADCVRVRRKNFYIRHGFEPTGIFTRVAAADYELMTYRCKVSYDEYEALYIEAFGERLRGKTVRTG